MTSMDLKKTLAHHLYWRLKYQVVCDEFKFMDIIAIRSSGYAVEFEIKVSKADLNREIRCITAIDCQKYGKDWEKFIKHKMYLTGEFPKTDYDLRMEAMGIFANTQEILRPSEFYFYVPENLIDYAVKKVEELGLPYGVVGIRMEKNWSNPYHMARKATKLHPGKATDSLYRQLAHALTIRSRLLQ